ncbi:hypothetical protein CR513_52950, partial [Mucuna pruriens]
MEDIEVILRDSPTNMDDLRTKATSYIQMKEMIEYRDNLGHTVRRSVQLRPNYPSPTTPFAHGTDKTKYCHYHKNYNHITKGCITLRDKIEELIQAGHLIKFIKRGANLKHLIGGESGRREENEHRGWSRPRDAIEHHSRNKCPDATSPQGSKESSTPLLGDLNCQGRKFLGFMLTYRGIEANPDKCDAIIRMKSPHNVKEVQRLTGRLTLLSCFLSRAAKKA